MAMEKFLTTVPRYVDGKYVQASAEYPAEVMIDTEAFPGYKNDRGLIKPPPPDAPAPEPQKLKVPYADTPRGPAAKGPFAGKKTGGRPSDEEP